MSAPTTPTPTAPETALTHRAGAMLRAVAARRALISGGSEPDLYVDGVPCCDQLTAHGLARGGLIRPAGVAPVRLGALVPAELTDAGRRALAAWTRWRAEPGDLG
ncbi:hypothetical protein SAMN05421810_10868 [Amycolatopsis arida]|uniref:Uncharacterized protein n=1 Tax=Amycolatopsis arida TaxID=587909 RepID=A0A1I5YYN2_9PSEU|nr:hypothetical protein [Amycolatopsis arida]TDX89981.1 hypothetical protein CLV69_10868 [Amycolatopsis arida]SFQ49309.1 hypothetical protein SAMN05421810_10868 [Amycolatopsis arida]